MKTLQNNFTTPEQSKRLLQSGVPADSADCIRVVDTGLVFFIQDGMSVEYYIDKYNSERDVKAEPCWSVGRLMEIAHICSGSNLSYKEETEELKKFKEAHGCETIIEAIIMCIEDAHSVGGMDFSKLEE